MSRRRIVRLNVAFATCALLSSLCFAEEAKRGEDTFPFSAYVSDEALPVRSGPGDEFYATQRLRVGTRVEVYHRVPGDWLAIRPPERSFSWVAAEHLELTETPTLARVINVPAKTRVGSLLSDEHDVEYVSLRPGEIVEILGQKLLQERPQAKPVKWFQIAPPAGEFRWVHRDALTRTPPQTQAPLTTLPEASPLSADVAEVAAEVASAGATAVREGALTDEPAQLDPAAVADAETVPIYPLDAAATPSPSAADIEETKVELVQHSVVEGNIEEEDTHVNAVTWRAVGDPTDVLSAPEPRSFQDRFQALNIMLSRAVLADVKQWDLTPVMEQAERLMELAGDHQQQTTAKTLLSKIDDFRALHERSVQPSGRPAASSEVVPAGGAVANGGVVTTAGATVDLPQIVRATDEGLAAKTPNVRPEIDNSVFDATGKLIQVRSSGRKNIPRYALTDSKGRLTRFLSTSNGDSLDAFVNKQVGVMGKAGFLRSLNKPHIVASKVVHLVR